MSKQFLTLHTADKAHPTDIFALAATPTTLLSASGSSTIRIFDTTAPDFPLTQSIENAHKLGVHHLVTSKDGKVAASAGFEGTVKVWREDEAGVWGEVGLIKDSNKAGEIWAIALSADGSYLASTTYDGRINVWDLGQASMPKIREYETKGSFGMCVDLSADGHFTASGHENGSVYVFNNDTGRMLHSLAGLTKPIRTLSFSPASKLLAAAGDTRIIALYDVSSGEQVANLSGHAGWVLNLDWSATGEWLLSGSHDSKAKVWSLESRTCVATHSHGDQALWAVKWLPKTGRSELFALAGGDGSVAFYREAAGG
ncbi:WD40 repeat-like protein [Lophium mytilinum]|uniref:WD40 repeat-like protein n=1 Tax=Lophium mytilinum TaxID=390894 RepID=A0A6A6QFI6_9PEZI|nr:WD40 repeat-like protein [Lophium mytilinum]